MKLKAATQKRNKLVSVHAIVFILSSIHASNVLFCEFSTFSVGVLVFLRCFFNKIEHVGNLKFSRIRYRIAHGAHLQKCKLQSNIYLPPV